MEVRRLAEGNSQQTSVLGDALGSASVRGGEGQDGDERDDDGEDGHGEGGDEVRVGQVEVARACWPGVGLGEGK